MKKKNLDKVFLKKNEPCGLIENLERGDLFEELSVEEILQQIRITAKTLSLDYSKAIQKQPEIISVKKEMMQNSVIKRIARKIDIGLKNSPLYCEKIRPKLVCVFGKVNARNEIDGKKLLSYEGVEFADAIYYSILDRAPDPITRENIQKSLEFSECTKTDLIYKLWHSDEASLKSLNITGIKCRHIYEVCKKKLYAALVMRR